MVAREIGIKCAVHVPVSPVVHTVTVEFSPTRQLASPTALAHIREGIDKVGPSAGYLITAEWTARDGKHSTAMENLPLATTAQEFESLDGRIVAKRTEEGEREKRLATMLEAQVTQIKQELLKQTEKQTKELLNQAEKRTEKLLKQAEKQTKGLDAKLKQAEKQTKELQAKVANQQQQLTSQRQHLDKLSACSKPYMRIARRALVDMVRLQLVKQAGQWIKGRCMRNWDACLQQLKSKTSLSDKALALTRKGAGTPQQQGNKAVHAVSRHMLELCVQNQGAAWKELYAFVCPPKVTTKQQSRKRKREQSSIS